MGRNDPDPLPDFLVLQTPDMDTVKVKMASLVPYLCFHVLNVDILLTDSLFKRF